MHLAMKFLGFNQNEKVIRKAMKSTNLYCEIRRKRKNYKKVETSNKCTNYLNQKFYPTKPNSCYSVDITYLQTKKRNSLCKCNTRFIWENTNCLSFKLQL